MTEIQSYRVLETHPGFELRLYEPHTLVTTKVQGDLGSAGYQAFGSLASFIGGNNQKGESIAMTAPVLQKKSDTGYQVSFVMPKGILNPPAPVSSKLELEVVPELMMAAIRFSGSATEKLFFEKRQKLLELIKEQGFKTTGDPLYARYNGPWTPAFLRRNEILLPVSRA